MYLLSLFASVILYPISAVYLIPKLSKRKSFIFLSLSIVAGAVFAYFSTWHGFTFEYNVLDALLINTFLFSLSGLPVWLTHTYFNKNKWLQATGILLSASTAFYLSFNAFGPSEACGQRPSEETYYLGKSYKLTHTGYQYGYMDYGSRFILFQYHLGTEKIIGLIENPIVYYGYYKGGYNIRLYLKSNKAIIKYKEDNNARIDTIYIQRIP